MSARIWSRLAWSAAGLALYVPIPLFVAFPGLAPEALRQVSHGAPLGVWFVAGVIGAIVLLTWICGALDGGDGEGGKGRGAAK